MSKVRRSRYAFLYLEDDAPIDVGALLRAELPAISHATQMVAVSILTGERHQLGRAEFDVLMSVPAHRWIDAGGLDPERLGELVEKGLLLSDIDAGRPAVLRERDEALSANEWNLYAALYHYMTQWSALDIRNGEEDEAQLTARSLAAAQAFAADHGPAPGAFPEPRSGSTLSLPGAHREGALYELLTERKTTRAFDLELPMTLEQLDAVLKYVFGCHGYAQTAADVVCIKRTSPSGGGLHPIEVYPIISNVTGVAPGIYHYSGRDHSLCLISELNPYEGRRMATSFMCGQSYFGAAHVSFVLTVRFYRNHWKYRRHQKAYAGILMDAAHLSQTLYLVSGDLELGAFVTIAINARDIEERLGLDGVTEGVIAMSGCGRRASEGSALGLRYSPWPPT